MLGLQAMVSIGVNLGALPTKGLTLPLISSGGASVLMTCAMAGVLLRATFEINRALDARQMATRMPAMAVADANAAVAAPREREAVAAGRPESRHRRTGRMHVRSTPARC